MAWIRDRAWIGPVLAVSAALLAGACIGCEQPGVGGHVYLVGDVRTVLTGQCTEDKFVTQRTDQMLAALGAGTDKDPASTGELLVLFGRAFARSTDAGTGYATRDLGRSFRTPFAMGLAASARRGMVAMSGVGRMQVQQFLAQRVGTAAVVALARAERLEATALKRAPIDGQDIQADRARYFHPTWVVRDKWVLLFVVSVEPGDAGERPAAKRLLERGLYSNTADFAQTSELSYHAHAWVLADRPAGATMEEMAAAAKVEDVVHVLGASVLDFDRVNIYPLDEKGLLLPRAARGVLTRTP